MNDGLKRATKEAVYFFLIPLIAAISIGKGIFEYMVWSLEVSKASGLSSMYVVLLAMAPFIVAIFIASIAMFYWLNNKKG